MLNPSEKAYCQALLALKRKDYVAAAEQFEKASPGFSGNKEFVLIRETTRLLLAVRDKLSVMEGNDSIEIEEAFSHGQKTELR